MNTPAQFPAFLYKTQNKAFEEKRKSIPKIYTSYTVKGDASKADYRSVTALGLGPAGYTPLQGKVHTDEYGQGSEFIIGYKKFTIATVTPPELIYDMQHNQGRIDEDKVKLFRNMTMGFVDSMIWTIEIICSDFFLRATSTTPTNTWQGVGRDGLALASTSHVTAKGIPVPWSNLQTTGPLNMLSMVDGVTMLENQPTETGRVQGAISKIGVVHGRYLEWRVNELIKTQKQPDTFNNNPNLMHVRDGVSFVPILNQYLGSSTTWSLIDLDNNPLQFFEREAPHMRKDVDVYTGANVNACEMRIAAAFETAKGFNQNLGV